MPFKKGDPRPEKAGRKKGSPNRKTVEIAQVVRAFTDYINEHSEGILDDLREKNPSALATFLAKVAPKDINLSGTAAPFTVVELPKPKNDE